MKANLDSDGIPLCPDCNVCLDRADDNGRDRETMGGYSIEYYQCGGCNDQFELINDGFEKTIYPA